MQAGDAVQITSPGGPPHPRSGALDDEGHRACRVRLALIERQHHQWPRQAVDRGEVQRVEGSNLIPTADIGGSLEACEVDRDHALAGILRRWIRFAGEKRGSPRRRFSRRWRQSTHSSPITSPPCAIRTAPARRRV